MGKQVQSKKKIKLLNFSNRPHDTGEKPAELEDSKGKKYYMDLSGTIPMLLILTNLKIGVVIADTRKELIYVNPDGNTPKEVTVVEMNS